MATQAPVKLRQDLTEIRLGHRRNIRGDVWHSVRGEHVDERIMCRSKPVPSGHVVVNKGTDAHTRPDRRSFPPNHIWVIRWPEPALRSSRTMHRFHVLAIGGSICTPVGSLSLTIHAGAKRFCWLETEGV